MRNPADTLRARTTCLAVNLLALWAVLYEITGHPLPSGGLESVWFLSAIAYLFFSLISSPWFVPPRDALANSVASSAILVTMDLSSTETYVDPHLDLFRWLAVGYNGVVSAGAVVALVLHENKQGSAIAQLAYRVSTVLGRGDVLYTPPALISILGGYQGSSPDLGLLVAVWTVFVTMKPVERFASIISSWRRESLAGTRAPDIGGIERVDFPNILRVRLSRGASWKPGTLHVASMSDGDLRYVLALFQQVLGTEVMGTGLCVANAVEPAVPAGRVWLTHDPEKATKFIENLSGAKDAELIGFTVENSNIGMLRFEIASDSKLDEGDVVFAKVRGEDVFYQILDAETSEESFDQNPRGTCIVRAAQLGSYSPDAGFKKYPWLPTMNSPLFWAKNRQFPPPLLKRDEFIVGDVPSTNIGVVANLNNLVEYHTAVLGVTGTGKTELVLEIIREAIAREARVFCVDFTGEYRARLADLLPVTPAPDEADIADLEKKLFDAETGAYNAGAEKKLLDAALKTMKASVGAQIAGFLEGEDHRLSILELSEIANTKATLRLTEMYLSEIMAWARKNRKARQILIVLEEAHTVIPETHGAGFDFDTQWVVSRIGQIALQGRKYGVGLLIVSQRTALVSKTILSQCNTFFAHSLVDQTSLGFLESVFGNAHVRIVPNLRFLECLAYGKGLRTERPILIKRRFDQEKLKASDALRRPLAAKPPEDVHAEEVDPAVWVEKLEKD